MTFTTLNRSIQIASGVHPHRGENNHLNQIICRYLVTSDKAVSATSVELKNITQFAEHRNVLHVLKQKSLLEDLKILIHYIYINRIGWIV